MSQIMKNSQKVKCKCFISHGDEVNDDDNVNNISFTELKKVLDILKNVSFGHFNVNSIRNKLESVKAKMIPLFQMFNSIFRDIEYFEKIEGFFFVKSKI